MPKRHLDTRTIVVAKISNKVLTAPTVASILPILKRLYRSDLSESQNLTLLAIGSGHSCVTTITDETGLGEWTVHHALNALRAGGLINSKTQRKGTGKVEPGKRFSAHTLTPSGARYVRTVLTGASDSSPQPKEAPAL